MSGLIFSICINPLVFQSLFVLIHLIMPSKPSLNLFETGIYAVHQDLAQDAALAIALLVFDSYLFTRHDGK